MSSEMGRDTQRKRLMILIDDDCADCNHSPVDIRGMALETKRKTKNNGRSVYGTIIV